MEEEKKEEKVQEKPRAQKWKPYKKNRYRTGEDIDMLREKNSTHSSTRNICDTHIDGA